MSTENILIIILSFWILVLTVSFVLFWRFFNNLTKGEKGASLKKTLENLLKAKKENNSEIERLKKEIERLDKENKLHIQKVALVRFNPFTETGGDHSFSLAILDDNDTGFVLTGLHTRERTRVYIKDVNNGTSKIKLSKEEKKAVNKAIR